MTRYDEQDAQERAEEREFRRLLGLDARLYYEAWAYSLGDADNPDDPEGSLELLAEYDGETEQTE